MGRYILNTATGTASPAVYVKQNDKGYALDFEIRNGSEAFDLTGCIVLFNLLKPDTNTSALARSLLPLTDSRRYGLTATGR